MTGGGKENARGFAEAGFESAEIHPSPNFGDRRGGPPDMLVLHYTGMNSAGAALDRLCSPRAQVSAHYLVFEEGRIAQLVAEDKRAWHAGESLWHGERDNNSRSIGIEIANPGHNDAAPEFPPRQIDAVIRLCRDCVARWNIPPERVLAHSDIAPLRKRDPGERFPWRTLFEAGVGHHVEPSPTAGARVFVRGDHGQPVEALQAMFAAYGYGIAINGVFDELTEAVTRAFQRHFRPDRVDGVADVSTVDTLRRLCCALPPGAGQTG